MLELVRSRVAGGAGQCVSLGLAAQLGGPGRGEVVAGGGVYGGLLVVCGWWWARPAGSVPAPGGSDPVKGRNPSLARKAGLGAGATLTAGNSVTDSAAAAMDSGQGADHK